MENELVIRNNFLKLCVFFIPIYFIFLTSPESMNIYTYYKAYGAFPASEDQIFENLTSIFYIISGMFSVLIFRIFFKINKKTFGIIYLIFGIFFFIGGFEEISWGQRILNFETPEIFSSNETTIHNLKGIHENQILFYVLVGSFGSFVWIFVHNKKRPYEFAKYFIPNYFFIVFFIPYVLYVIAEVGTYLQMPELSTFIFKNVLLSHTHEFYELLQTTGIMVFVISVYLKLNDLIYWKGY